MSFAPTAYSTGSSLLNTIGNIAIGGKPSGAPGGTFGGITVRNLMGALTPTSLIQRAVGGASFVKSNAQKAIQFIRGADAEKAKLEYAANPDNYDLSNVNFFPTAGNSELTRQNLSMLADLQNYQQEVELKPIGGSEDCQNQSQRRVQRFYCCAAGQPEHQHL